MLQYALWFGRQRAPFSVKDVVDAAVHLRALYRCAAHQTMAESELLPMSSAIGLGRPANVTFTKLETTDWETKRDQAALCASEKGP